MRSDCLLRSRAEPLARLLLEEEREDLASVAGSPWLGTSTEAYRAPELRVQIYADLLRALAGVLEGGEEALPSTSDWLRLNTSLFVELEPGHIERLIPKLNARLSAALAAELSADDPLAETVASLAAQLPPAIAAFSCLPELNRIRDFTTANIEKYWDASAIQAPLFTIDWASFGREDLFEANGLRAARWLSANGYAGAKDRILQIGCGVGRIERHLSPRVAAVYGVDISKEMVRQAKQRLAGLGNVTLLHGDGRTLPLPDRSVETVFSFLVLIHVHDPEIRGALLRETRRVLVPGGRCLITLTARDRMLEYLAFSTGLKISGSGPVPDRAINSFAYERDWLYEFTAPG